MGDAAEHPRGQARRRARVMPAYAAVGVLLLCASVSQCVGDMVRYVLTPQVKTGCLRVELTWNTRGRTQSALVVAPRCGTVEDVPALIRDLQFSGVTGVRQQKQRWLLDHPRGGAVTCRYEIDPGRRKLTWAAPHYPVTSRTFFHGIGNAFLLVPQSGGGLPEEYDVALRWELPERWQAVCSWGTGPHVGARLAPADLRNSVYLAGRIVKHTAQRDGRSVTVGMLDRFGFSAAEFADLAATIVAHECDFMAEEDFPELVVTAVPVGEALKAGDTRLVGMGLYQSFCLLAAPKMKLTDGFEHLFAHELFHYWNGRLLPARRPDKLAYWFVEGFTDYYALRILYESGYWQPDVYAKWINRHLRRYHSNLAMHATNQDILERFWKERDTVGEVPYQRGLLLGLRWHRLARDRGVPDGIDRLFKSLVERGRREGFEVSNEAIRRAGIKELGDWFGPEFDRFVVEADTIDVPRDALAPGLKGYVRQIYDSELGFDRASSLRKRRVHGLVRGSAAEKAGLREGDHLLGWKIPGDTEQRIELQVLQKDNVKTIRYYPRGKRRSILQFEPAEPDRGKQP